VITSEKSKPERFRGTLRPLDQAECLDWMVILGEVEGHLRRAVASYMEHYHLERCHQGIGNRPIGGVPKPSSGHVARLERLGGILSHYYRDAP